MESEFSWETAYQKCITLCEEGVENTPKDGKAIVDIIIYDLVNWGKLRQAAPHEYDRTEWLLIYEWCKRETKVQRSENCTNNWSYNSAAFIERCREAMNAVDVGLEPTITTDDDRQEATGVSFNADDNNEMPSQAEGIRKLQMDKKLNTWLISADGTKKAISCREICERFKDGSIITRLRAGIDSGADISTVELD